MFAVIYLIGFLIVMCWFLVCFACINKKPYELFFILTIAVELGIVWPCVVLYVLLVGGFLVVKKHIEE